MIIQEDIFAVENKREKKLENYKVGHIEDYQDKDYIDYTLEPVEKEFISKVEKSHKQLGALLWFAYNIVNTRKLGLLIIGAKGIGKSATGRTLAKHLTGVNIIKADGGFTPAFVKKSELEKVLQNAYVYCDDGNLFLYNSTTIESLLMISSLIEAGEYYGGNIAQPIIKNANISFVCAGTPNFITDLVAIKVFDGMIKDRMLRYYHMYYNFPYKDGLPDAVSSLPEIDDMPLYNNIPELPMNTSKEMMKKGYEMLCSQFTDFRALNYLKRIINTHAFLCNKSKVDDNDIKWLLCYSPFIKIESKWLARPVNNVDGLYVSGRTVYGDVFPEILFWLAHSPKTINELKQKTNYSEYRIMLALEELQRKGYCKQNKDIFTIDGKFANELKRFYEIFNGGN